MKFIKNNFSVILLLIAEIIIGIMLLVEPVKFTKALIIVFGIILVIIGIIFLIRYFSDKKNNLNPSAAAIVLSIISIVIGLVIVIFPEAIMGLFPVIAVIYGIFLIISGIYKFVVYAEIKKTGVPASALYIVSGILSLILGIIIVIHPFTAVGVLWTFTGIALIVGGVVDIISLIAGAKKGSNKNA